MPTIPWPVDPVGPGGVRTPYGLRKFREGKKCSRLLHHCRFGNNLLPN
jgi:hypothetical protein